MTKQDSNALILVVDDQPQNIHLLGSYLKRHNFRIAVATNGNQAISYLEAQVPDVILLDELMPDMDGFETCKMIRANHRFDEVPIIFLGLESENNSKARGFECGGADYLIRPFREDEVIARVQAQVNLKKMGEHLKDIKMHLEEGADQLG